MNFFEFYTLGSESYCTHKNFYIRKFIKNFGPLGINAKIRSGHIIQSILRLNIHNEMNLQVLDVGCGVSYLDFWIANRYTDWNILGIDIDRDAINKSLKIKENKFVGNIDFLKMNILDLEIQNHFDVVYSMDVLEHIHDDLGALKIIYNALKIDGYLILHLPLNYKLNQRILPGFYDYYTYDHVREEYTLDEISQKLDEVGFRIISSYYSYSFWGELAFELNYLFWKKPKIRLLFAFIFHLISNLFGYIDIKNQFKSGNGIVMIVKK